MKAFLIENRAEVKNMFLTEYNEEKVLEHERAEGIREGEKKGEKKGKEERSKEVAADLIREGGMTTAFIARISRLSEATIIEMAESMKAARF